MKLTSAAPLALALAAGIAGAAAAQTPTSASTYPATPQPPTNYAQPQASATPAQPPYGQTQATVGQTTPQMQPSAGQVQPAPPATSATAQTPNNGNEQVKQAQRQLHAAGLYNGPADGVMDPDTRAAIARFQQQHGLPRTEDLDQATLSRLEGGQTTGYGSTAPTNGPVPAGTSTAPLAGGNNGKSTAR